MTTATGQCTTCWRTYRLKNDGTLRAHWKRDGQGNGLPFSDPCPGSGRAPAVPFTPEA